MVTNRKFFYISPELYLVGIWTETIYIEGENVEFKSVNYCGEIENIYRKVPGLERVD